MMRRFHPPASLDTHSRRFDSLYALRFYLLVLFGVVLAAAVSAKARAAQRPRLLLRACAGVSTIAVLVTSTLAGHAAVGLQTPLALLADLLHLLAMTVWLGGLVMVTASLLPGRRAGDLASVLPLFSRLAFTCVVLLVTTGSYQVWRQVGHWAP